MQKSPAVPAVAAGVMFRFQRARLPGAVPMWDKQKKKHIGEHHLRPESLMMSFGYRPEWSEGAAKPPIFQTSTFVFESAEAGKAFFEVAYGLREKGPLETPGLIYSRLNNPGLEILEDRLTVWDGAEAAAVFQSGMAAIATTIFTFVRPGDLVVFAEPIYGGTEYLLHEVLPHFGVETACFPAVEGLDGLRRVLGEENRQRRLRMVFIETPANPTNALMDIEGCVQVARTCETDERKVIVAVDNTFLGPIYQHPLKGGADLVLYSLTKYVGGHSDLIAGACLGAEGLIGQVKVTRTIFGTMAGPWTSWLLLRSVETLKLRMTAQTKSARYVADFLARHPKVERVHYLGHLEEGDPQLEIYRKQCLGAGGMISFDIQGGEAEAFRFLNHLELIKLAVSLGGTESLAEHPGAMTHSDVPPDEQLKMGITPALIRISVGVEHPEDIIADIEQALAAV
jgi:methionine-gamma-lyase